MTITDREAYEVLANQLDEIYEFLKTYGIDEDFFSEDPLGAVCSAMQIDHLSTAVKCMKATCVWCRHDIPLKDPDTEAEYRHENGGLCDAYAIRIALDAESL